MNGESFDIETYTGTHLTWASLDPSLIRIEDIAHALGMQCRYNGHCSSFYSVAEHCVLAAMLMKREGYSERLQLLTLLHDAAETYIGDIVRPVKDAIPAIKVLEASVEAVIWEGLRIPPPNDGEVVLVKMADNIMLATEADELMPSGGASWTLAERPDPGIALGLWRPAVASRCFLNRYESLTEAPQC